MGRRCNGLWWGEEVEKMRNKARGFKEMAAKSIEEGGSSQADLNFLIRELSSYQA